MSPSHSELMRQMIGPPQRRASAVELHTPAIPKEPLPVLIGRIIGGPDGPAVYVRTLVAEQDAA